MRVRRAIIIVGLLFLCLQTANADWVKQRTNTLAWLKDIFFLDHDRGWISGSDGTLISTADGGLSWTPVKKFTADSIDQVYFSDELNGWLLCSRSIYARGASASSYLQKTKDGGRTWDKIEFLDGGRERVTKLLFNKNGRGIAFGESGVFYDLQQDGVSWKKIRSSTRYLLLNGAYLDDSLGSIVGGGGTILFTEDSGFTWQRATLFGETDIKFNAVAFNEKRIGVAVAAQGNIFRSVGGGRQWRQLRSDTTSDLNDVAFTGPYSGWAVGDDGVILGTRDAGGTWYQVRSNSTHRLEKVVFNGTRGWAVGFGGTILTYDPSPSRSSPGNAPMLLKRN